MNLSASPGRPACPSRASGWSSLTTPWGLPCCVRFPCVHAVATTPAQRLANSLCSAHPAVSAFPERVVGSACALSFSRIAQRSLALRPAHWRCHLFVTLIEGYSHFVTSMTAPIASGWSGCRVGFAPTGKRRLVTAHTRFRGYGTRRRKERQNFAAQLADARLDFGLVRKRGRVIPPTTPAPSAKSTMLRSSSFAIYLRLLCSLTSGFSN